MEIASVELYFHEVLTSALRSENVKVKDATEYYLVHLLCNYTRAQLDPEPLALKLIHAAEALPADRIRLLQEVGDTALTTSGLFGESLSRRTIPRRLRYVDLGRCCVRSAGCDSQTAESAILRDACSELAERFPRLVDVLLCLRSRINLAVLSDLIELYERWYATGKSCPGTASASKRESRFRASKRVTNFRYLKALPTSLQEQSLLANT